MMLLSENYFHEEQFSRTKMTFKPILKYMLYPALQRSQMFILDLITEVL